MKWRLEITYMESSVIPSYLTLHRDHEMWPNNVACSGFKGASILSGHPSTFIGSQAAK
jgi:hypothetical protein